MRKHWAIILILALSALTHFAYYGHPNQTVFDEVHFGKFISGYFTGEYFFDIHPPLGKLLISAAGYLTGFKSGFSFANIGEVFPDKHYLALRFLPALAGFLLPLVIYGLTRRIGLSAIGSFLAALFVILENALTVQSRFILLDSFLLLFGFSALWFYFLYRRKPKISYLLAAGILGALAVSVKWTGASFLGIIFIFELFEWFKHKKLKPAVTGFLSLVLLPAAIYISIFAIHLGLLSRSGPGDAFMSPEFQKTLSGNEYQKDLSVQKIGFLGKFVELNEQMYLSNQRLTTPHPYGSKWYSWPFMARPIYYWNKSVAGAEEKIYLLGNPFIWWSTIIVMVLLAGQSIHDFIKRKKLPLPAKLILLGFGLNLLPFVGITRVMFLYHYFVSLVFGILALAFLTDQGVKRKKAAVILSLVAAFVFLYFSPLTYGLPLTPKEQSLLFWLPSWR